MGSLEIFRAQVKRGQRRKSRANGNSRRLIPNIRVIIHTTQKGLDAPPYHAKVVGDYTGLTPSFEFDED
jgi:hypothetical protein